ncbi:DUF1707 and DUF4190 domain-containing protein [Streptomyces sp. NPDC003077]|uniref:DUF1707 and DUF4190 domain-containing protein n=1 Tax=Streptomyces sp. NPDC003077 TaxID=3154443 RepID=UPI0033B9520E
MRASHADRERAVDVLKAGFAEGRLTQQEYELRMGRAYEAQTHGELQSLVGDLPVGPASAPFTPQQPAVPATFAPVAPVLPPVNGTATGALVCGILVPIVGISAIPAVILGHKARAEIRRTGERGDGFALAGLIMGWLGIGAGALIVVMLMVAVMFSVR